MVVGHLASTVRLLDRLARCTILVAALSMAVVACGDGADEVQAVTSRVVSDPTAPHLRLLTPDGDGPWPVVLALHGYKGTGQDMVELATRVARAGAVVYVPTFNTDLSTEEGLVRAGDDLSCAYQVARRTAPDYGGDLSQPVTVVGWSLGADLAVLGALGPQDDPSIGRCPGDVPRPDVVVAIAGCYYQFQGGPVTWFDDLNSWTSKDVDVHLVAGDKDTTCPASQTDRLASSLRTVGYEVAVIHLRSGNHGAPIFHDERDGKWQVITKDPSGDRAVEVILDAIDAARSGTSG